MQFYLKKNKILRVHVKDKSCNSFQDFRPLLKKDSDTGVFLWIFHKFYEQPFFRTIPVDVEFSKKKVSGEIAFDLISLFHVQIQEPTSRSTTQEHLSFLQNLLNFIITNYLKQEVDDDLSACVDERSTCGLSITGDIKIY